MFRDPFARRLAGPRGEQILQAMPASKSQEWAWITRTYLFDQFINEQVAQGVDMVVNLAAGVDARPYRLKLPGSLKWVEVDLPDLLREKQEILRGEQPVCSLEHVGLDVSDEAARRALFNRLGREAKKVLIVSEGLLVYLTPEQVGSLAEDLAGPATFERLGLRTGVARPLEHAAAQPPAAARKSGRALEIRARGRAFIFRPARLETDRRAVNHQSGRAPQTIVAGDANLGHAPGIVRRTGLAAVVGDLLDGKRMNREMWKSRAIVKFTRDSASVEGRAACASQQ